MEAFCNVDKNITLTHELEKVKNVFIYAQVIFCFFGVVGNILNLRTLQSPSLQTVPFMYIRALAVFDLIALTMIMFHFALVNEKDNMFIMVYTTYIEAPVINTFLIAGLYCAFFLTLERYCLITRPYHKPICNPITMARFKIGILLFMSAVMHSPMVLQRTMKKDEKGLYGMINNVDLLCKEPHWSIFSYYKLGRELLRFLIVIIMSVLNVYIARQLQLTKIRRRRLVRRNSPPVESPLASHLDTEATASPHPRRETASPLLNSFTEKKLTVLMISICFIFIIGNVPQMIVMVLQNEAMEDVYSFQVYRYSSNLLEVVNHCLNFYVFCMASSEYTRAFLLNCVCLRTILFKIPSAAKFLNARRGSRFNVMAASSGYEMKNKEYLSMDSFPGEAKEWAINTETDETDSKVKSILITNSNKETRQKKSLTIVNHRAQDAQGPPDQV